MTEWHEIVRIRGQPQAGNVSFECNFVLPEVVDNLEATSFQIDAVNQSYQRDFPSLTASQAHALLSYREYARLCCDAIFPKYPPGLKRSLSACLAAFISSDAGVAKFATTWSERNFDGGVGSPRVRGTPYFPDMQAFAEYLDGSLSIAGFEISKFK